MLSLAGWLAGWLAGCLPACLPACLPVCLPACLSIRPFLCVRVRVCVLLSVCLSVRLSVRLSVCLSFSLAVCLSFSVLVFCLRVACCVCAQNIQVCGHLGACSEELLEQSDVVTMHVPLDSVTQAMASREFFARMKPSKQ